MRESSFRRRILEKASENSSRVILAFDEPCVEGDFNRLSILCECLAEHVAGVKLGIPAMLSTGIRELSRLISRFSEKCVFIADVKMADVSHVNSLTARLLYDAGFDAVISHGFIGYEGGLEGLFREAETRGGGVILVASMSHSASVEFIDHVMERIVDIALTHGADGVVAPATRTSIIQKVSRMAGGRLLIFTPGIGAQGAGYGAGLSAGGDFEIIGRSILEAPDPLQKLMEVRNIHEKTLAGRPR
ncbi:MAG: orotidine-5'-phosphate decarboxylase [Thermoproteota archaeon]